MVCKIVHQVPTNPTHQAILKHEIFHSLDTLASLKCSLIKRWFSPLFACSPCSRRSSHFSPQHFLKPSLGYAGINLWAFSPSAPATTSSLNHFPAGFIGHAVVALLAFLFPPPPAACFRFAAGRGGGAFVVGACAPHLLCIGGALSLDTNFAIFI